MEQLLVIPNKGACKVLQSLTRMMEQISTY